MATRAGTYSKVHDFAKIKQDAQQAVERELGVIARPDERLRRAAEMIRQADAVIAAHIVERDEAAASLWFYEFVPGVARVLGVTPTAYREILAKVMYGDAKHPLPATFTTRDPSAKVVSREELSQLAKKAGVRRVEDAAARLPELARVVAEAKARRAAALAFLRDAALVLKEEPYGWDGAKIAQVADTTEEQVWKHWKAARKRRDS